MAASDLFSVTVFFIVFRETIEAAIIVSVLLSFVEQLMTTGKLSPTDSTPSLDSNGAGDNAEQTDSQKERVRVLLKRMRVQIWAGTLTGFGIALAVGAAFIAVFYTKLTDLWSQTEQLWEGVFSIIAAAIIYAMGIAFLKMDRSRIKWRYKLAAAFERSHRKAMAADAVEQRGANPQRDGEAGEAAPLADGAAPLENTEDKVEAKGGKWALFVLPLITVLREGLEAIIFVGGVSLNEKAKSIPIAVVVGLICGIIVGYLIYRTGSTATLHWFLIGSTSFLFLIGAGLMSKGPLALLTTQIGYFQYYRFETGVGSDVSESGDGPGSFQVAGNVWHLTYGNPENGAVTYNGGWGLFNAILGWNNTATLGSILSYVFYWLWIVGTLVYLKWKEGRVTFFGRGSAAHHGRLEMRARWAREVPEQSPVLASSVEGKAETPMTEKNMNDMRDVPTLLRN